MSFLRRVYPFNLEQTVNVLSEFGPLMTLFVVQKFFGPTIGVWSLIATTVLALVVMRDYGMDNRDIAEIFGRSPRWARLVRERAVELREAEPIREELEYLDDGLQQGDPTPMEILEQAEALRVAGAYRSRLPTHRRELNAFVQECA
jgi:hypothetical protein